MLDSPLFLRLRTRLWEDRASYSLGESWALCVGRYAFALARDLFLGELSMRAMSLVYTTLLSLVPFLALGFSVLKALGVHNRLEPVLLEFLRPLGPQAQEIADNLIGFVEKIQVGVLGSLGVTLLFYTAISLIRKVESSFNYIWRIERPRPFAQRVGEYLGVLMVGPVIVFSALGLTASILNSAVVADIRNIEPFGFFIFSLTRLIPYALIVGMFTFLYVYMPNARVSWRAAGIGGLTAGVLWQTASVVFAHFVAGATNYNAIYSSFAIIIYLLIWLYLGWLILLTGCQLSFYVQRPRYMGPHRIAPRLPGREAEHIALLLMGVAGRRFLEGQPGLTEEDYAGVLKAPPEHVERAVEILLERGFLVEAGATRAQLVPARDLEAVTVAELWKAFRSGGTSPRTSDPLGADAARMLDEAEAAFASGAGSMTLRAWLLSTKSL